MGAKQSAQTQRGLKLVKRGWPIAKAARQVGIYRSTLQRALKKGK